MKKMTSHSDMLKRYEYYTKGGIELTPWFRWDSDECPKWQLKGKLRNFYKDDIDEIVLTKKN